MTTFLIQILLLKYRNKSIPKYLRETYKENIQEKNTNKPPIRYSNTRLSNVQTTVALTANPNTTITIFTNKRSK